MDEVSTDTLSSRTDGQRGQLLILLKFSLSPFLFLKDRQPCNIFVQFVPLSVYLYDRRTYILYYIYHIYI
jgi:hypothetical protein